MTKEKRALDFIQSCGVIDGAHHKQWIIDHIVRILADDYEAWVKEYEYGKDGAETYKWEEGIAP